MLAPPAAPPREVPVEAKLRFLRSAAAWGPPGPPPECIETHMSWVFMVGDHVLKLKKPVRHAFLDFSTLARREFYCREELRLNARLAPGVYIGLLALQTSASGWSLAREGEQLPGATTVDWLVLMRRLPAQRMLSDRLARGAVEAGDINALGRLLGRFYRDAPPAPVAPATHLARLRHEQAINRDLLGRPGFALAGASRALDAFDALLSARAGALCNRVAAGHLVEGHGDLRPEHVCLSTPPRVIDCLEFNAALRQVDPFDEIALLGLECELGGAPWVGPRLAAALTHALGAAPPPGLWRLYVAQRALLRARLSIAHLLDPVVRTPERWPAQAQRYLDHALRTLGAD